MGKTSLPLDELLQQLQAQPDKDLQRCFTQREDASGKIQRMYEEVSLSFQSIEAALREVDPRHAYQEVLKIGRKVDLFFANQVQYMRTAVLSQEAAAQLEELRLAQVVLNEKVRLFKGYVQDIQVLYDASHYHCILKENGTRLDIDAADAAGNLPAPEDPSVKATISPEGMFPPPKTPSAEQLKKLQQLQRARKIEPVLYFQRLVSFADDDPLADALVQLKQREMYLPSVHLVASLDTFLFPPSSKKSAKEKKKRKRNLLQDDEVNNQDGGVDKPNTRKVFAVMQDGGLTEDSFEAPENYFFMTGTYCTLHRSFQLNHYLRQEPNSHLRLNTSHAPEHDDGNDDEVDRPWNSRFRVGKAEKKALFPYLAGGKMLTPYADLRHDLKQGIVVIRSRYDGSKKILEVATQQANAMMARFFYGATEDQEKMVAYLLEGSREIDARRGVITKELKI